MSVSANLKCPAGQNITFQVSPDPSTPLTDITGWTFAFTIYDWNYVTKAQATSAGRQIAITDGPNGVLQVTLTNSQTNLPSGRYYFDLFRVDSGFEDCLTRGYFYIERSAYQATIPP